MNSPSQAYLLSTSITLKWMQLGTFVYIFEFFFKELWTVALQETDYPLFQRVLRHTRAASSEHAGTVPKRKPFHHSYLRAFHTMLTLPQVAAMRQGKSTCLSAFSRKYSESNVKLQ